MTGEIFRFELRHHLRSPVFWSGVTLFFLLAFGAVTTDAVQIGGSIGAVNRNAPYVILSFMTVMSLVAVFVTTAFVAGAVIRDKEVGTDAILYATPMPKRAYLLGRFAGAYVASVLVLVGVAVAIWVGSLMPWLDPERVGPFLPLAYVDGMLLFVLPDLLFMGAVFFGLATLTRSMMGTYVGLVAYFVGYAVAMRMVAQLENERLAALLDPSGIAAFTVATKYWTTFQRNTQVLVPDGTLLWNRLLWIGVSILVLGLTYWRFSFTAGAVRKGKREKAARRERTARKVATRDEAAAHAAAARPAPPSHSVPVGSVWRQLLHQARFETRSVLRSVPFLVILAFGVLNLLGGAVAAENLYGTPVWPVTHLMISAIGSGFLLVAVVILTFYAGEVVWRERERNLGDVLDAMPVPNQVYWGGKMLALLAILVVVLAVAVAAAMGFQLYRGYTRLQPGLYLQGVFVQAGVPFALLSVLALAAQVLVNDKYLGFGVMVLYVVALPVANALDLTHNLYMYAASPDVPYSEMNGFGGFLGGVGWFQLYWAFGAVGLLLLAHLFWMRGRETRWRIRLALARRRFGRGVAATAALAAAGFVATGAWIFYNTNVLNDFESPDEARARSARYEKEYKRFEGVPQPRIVRVRADVDIHPERRAVEIRGAYRLVNRTDVAVDTLHLLVPPDLDVTALDVPGAERVQRDEEIGWSMWRFDRPMQPGDSLDLTFALGRDPRGFTNQPEDLELARNGTFFNNAGYFPHIGYARAFELQDPNERRKRGLPAVERMPPLGDSASRGRNYITGESDWIDFETEVSTSGDQVALAPGTLVRRWEEGGRNHFLYRARAPIVGFWAYLSGNWEVTEDHWGDVAISVYHLPEHAFNVGRMVDAVKKSLTYYTEHFGPYQHDYVRIVEFPRYASFAQSFPGTIPFSESIGFIARLTDPDAIDYVFYVTAHEVAHQWWAHQVMGAWQQGATVTSETLAQYSALMVMEHEYGREKMRRFLKYELDMYLRGRGTERVEELPLLKVENQGYIHYRKGSLVMYALKDYLGEDVLDSALRRYVTDVGFTGPPYTTSAELLSYIESVTPVDAQELVDDLFRKITLWELRTREVRAEPMDDGRWRVVLDVEAHKYDATGGGEETEVPLDAMIDVGVFGEAAEGTPPEGEVLYLEKRRITSGEQEIEVVVDEEPRQAGVDPLNELIDRDPENNVARVRR